MDTGRDALRQFSEWRGMSLIPPVWTVAPWKQLSSVLPNMSDMEVALKMLVEADVPFSNRMEYTHFFPGGAQRGHEQALKELNAQFAALGLKSTTYFNHFVETSYEPVFSLLRSKGWFVQNSSRQPMLFEYNGDIVSRHFFVAQIDFTHHEAAAWYGQQILEAMALGFAGAQTDYGEYLQPNAEVASGIPGFREHNHYPIVYHKAIYDALDALPYDHHQPVTPLSPYLKRGSSPEAKYAADWVSFVRSGYTQSGRYTWGHWSGDSASDWSRSAGLPAQITACLTAGLAGVSFCSSDGGGYVCLLRPILDDELLIRWIQFASVSGIMRDETEGSGCFGKRAQIFSSNETLFVWRKQAKLRTQPVPYSYSLAHETQRTGMPLMRHPVLMFD